MGQFFSLVWLLVLVPLVWAQPVSAAGQNWRIVSEPFPPYFAPDLPEQGWLWQVTKAALETQGIEATLEFMSWTRAMRLTASGQRTAALGAFFSEHRAQTYVYSAPIAYSQSGLFKRKADKRIHFNGELEQLLPFHISKGEFDLVNDALSVQPKLQISETASLVISLKLLLAGRVDLVAGTREVGEYWLKHSPELRQLSEKHPVIFLEPALAEHFMHLIFPKANRDALQQRNSFNLGLAGIYASGKLHRILAEHGFAEEQISRYVQTMGLK